jgi:hypothetical protein
VAGHWRLEWSGDSCFLAAVILFASNIGANNDDIEHEASVAAVALALAHSVKCDAMAGDLQSEWVSVTI